MSGLSLEIDARDGVTPALDGMQPRVVGNAAKDSG